MGHVSDFYNLADSGYLDGGFRLQMSSMTANVSHRVEFDKNGANSWSNATVIYYNSVLSGAVFANSNDQAFTIDVRHNDLIAAPYSMTDNETISFRVINDLLNDSTANATVLTTVAGGGNQMTYDIAIPTISSVTSGTGDGTYKIGDNINILVNFNEAVTLGGGSLQTTLNTGDIVSVAAATWNTSASGTYTVGSGDLTGTLDNTNISITTSSITDAAGNTLTSFTPAANLSASSVLDIDGVRPTISSVTSITSNGRFGIGDAIEFVVTFSEATTVAGGNLSVTFETGGVDRTVTIAGATYSNSTPALVFYTVQANDASGDLTTNNISITAGTIEDAAGNSLTNFTPGSNLAASSAFIVDGIRPTLQTVTSTTPNATYGIGDNVAVTLNFSEAVNVSGGNVEVTMETGATDQIVFITPFSNAYLATGTYTVIEGDVSADLTMSSTSEASNGILTDLAGNTVAAPPAVPLQSTNLAATKDIVIDGVRPTVTSITSLSADANYAIGDAITLQITMSEAVDWDGDNVVVTLETGAVDNTATVVSSSTSSSTEVATYTVAEGDETLDLTAISIGLSSGVLLDGGGNDVNDYTIPGGQNIADSKAIVVDGIRPTIVSISSGTADGTKAIGVAVVITITFSEDITTAGGGSIVVQLETGVVDTQITISGVVSSLTASGSYTVLEGHSSADLTVTSVTMSAGTLEDDFGNSMTVFTIPPGNNLADNAALVIDGVRPTVSSVSAITANGSYKETDVIDITVTFDDVVTVVGTPQLNLDLGGGYLVNYLSGSTTAMLTFRYTVQAGQNTADLAYLATSSLTDGTSIKDASGNDVILTLAAPGAANSLSANRDLIIDTQAPTALSVTSSTADGSYKAGDVISIQVTFDEAVDVTATPTLDLDYGGAWPVNYASGATTTVLTFTHTVQAGQNSTDLAYLTTTPITGTIEDAAGNSAVVILANPGDPLSLSGSKALIIDTIVPTVTLVTSSNANQYYVQSDVINVEVNFSEIVFVGGSPQITLETGATDAIVDYTSGSGTSTWIFQYTVDSLHESGDLDYGATTSLALNGGAIADLAGNNTILTLDTPGGANSLGGSKAIQIDAVIPTVSLVSANQADGIYKAGVAFDLVVALTEPVIVDLGLGTPTLTLDLGAGFPVAYTSGSSSDTLKFNYTILAGQDTIDLAYASTTALALSGATIRDIAGNDAILLLDTPTGPNSLSGIKNIDIDTQTPAVIDVTSAETDGPYTVGAVLSIDVVFDEAVTVSGGPPKLILETGAADQQVDLTSGSTTTTLTFDYTVQAGDVSADLDYISGAPFNLNAATLSDLAGNIVTPVTLPTAGGAGSLGDNKALIIDTDAPTVLEVIADTTTGSFNAASVIGILIVFSEDVTVTGGPPQLTLETGAADAVVNYTSGTGNDTLLFAYTVAAGETAADLDYTATTSLALNTGAMTDPAGNAADLTLASPGGAGSLGQAAGLIIDTTPPQVVLTYSDTLGVAGDVVTITATADEDLLALPAIRLTYNPTVIGPVDMDSVSTTVYTYAATLPTLNSGLAAVSLTGSDPAGNAIIDANLTDRVILLVDNVPPGYTVAYVDSTVKEGDVIDMTFTFEEPLDSIPLLSIDFAGTGSDITDTGMVNIGQDTIWTFQVTAPSGNDGFVTVVATANDQAGNAVVHTSGGTNTLLVDNTPPIVTATAPLDSAYVRTTAVSYSLGEPLDSGWVAWTWLNNAGVTDLNSPHKQLLAAAEISTGDHSGLITNAPALVQGAEYSIDFIAADASGNADTAAVSLMTYDTLAPVITGVTIVDGGDSTDVDSTRIRFTYSASFDGFSDAASPIALYEYALGTAAGDSNITGWTANGTDTIFTITGLNLAFKRYHFASVRATDAAGNLSAAATSDGVRIVDKARMTMGVVQNSAINEYLKVMVIDTIGMASSISVTVGGAAVTLTEIDSFVYFGTYELDTTGTISFIAAGTNATGDTTITNSVQINQALQAAPWSAISLDRVFAISAPAGAVRKDRLLAVIDSTVFNMTGTERGRYRLGSADIEFARPVQVKMVRDAHAAKGRDGQAIYILGADRSWAELPSTDEGKYVVAWTRRGGTFGLGPRTLVLPQATRLHPNYPNPFNPETHIVFDVGLEDGPQQRVSIVIYNLLGQQVRTLMTGPLMAGQYDVVWNGRDRTGASVASGIYFVRLVTGGGKVQTHKMALVR